MQTTSQYLSDSRVTQPAADEAIGWIRRQLRWEERLAELRRPRPVSPRPAPQRAAA